MTIRGQGLEGPQKYIIFGLPFLFAPFVASFEAGLSVYWISTNVWTFGQQQFVHMTDGHRRRSRRRRSWRRSKPPPPPPPKKKKKKSGRRR